jgi:predicted nucleotidyltransferase
MQLKESIISELSQACKASHVKELYVFGSALTNAFGNESDIDFLVVFDRKSPNGAFDQFMDLKIALERIFQRPVDLLVYRKFKNHLFQLEVDQHKQLIYAA